MGYSRADWNGLLDQVNAVITDPPADTDCEDIDISPLPQVGPCHRWSKADISEVQSKLSQTNVSITWNPIKDVWSAETISEILSNLALAWQECEDSFVFQPEVIYKTLPLEAYATGEITLGAPKACELPPSGNDFNLCDEIDGLKVMCEKFGGGAGVGSGRFWRAYNSITGDNPQTGPRLRVTGGSGGEIGQNSGYSGQVDRDGKINCTGFKQNGPQWRADSFFGTPTCGSTFWTFDCPAGDQFCQGRKDQADSRIADLMALGHTRFEFTLRFTDQFGNPIETEVDTGPCSG
ncbi:MAG: hypothetical protein DWQ31_16910 [Planctomycetota bacterium]|nr:MAG: hypothetical protein DWQ31_16910 [Planctomycetota bacterium]REJ92035.1 MAG: hypothetical protein DWQ35_12860 [Planctomycetota bacterium]REK28571.1 MAG: hypothetical protein DWQ42_04450 [Planctomycetota bacterium]REK39186.1 MAG: hypothetical protein DWQ46_18035 [Planctomycetota bacterium]